MTNRTPAEQQYAIALYFGRGNAKPPEPPNDGDWQPTYPNAWSWASNPEKRRPIEPDNTPPILPNA